jgi:AcrR family transcriptional regulator
MGMSIPYESSGRTRQKRRTREALVAATRELIAEGREPTVEDAAARARISRTTAYRYFTNQRALLVAAHPEIERTSLLGAKPPREPVGRLSALLEELHRIMLDTEPQLRMALRLSLDPANDHRDSTLRSGRAIAWVEDGLAPLSGQLSKQEMRRLTLAIRTAVGIEALVWLTDVARLSRGEAVDIMQWSAQALLRTAVAESKRKRATKRRD